MSNTTNGVVGGSGVIVSEWASDYIYSNIYGMSASVNTVNLEDLYLRTQAHWQPLFSHWTFYDETIATLQNLHTFEWQTAFTNEVVTRLAFSDLLDCGMITQISPTPNEQLPILPYNNYGLSMSVGWSDVNMSQTSSLLARKIVNGVVTNDVINLFNHTRTSSPYKVVNIYYFRGLYNGITYVGQCLFLHSVDEMNGYLILQGVAEDEIKTLVGGHTQTEQPQNDPQKGVPSLPIGASGDVVKQRIDEISLPPQPSMGVTTSGMLNVYRINQYGLQSFIGKIFKVSERTSYSTDDFGDILNNALKNLDKGLQDTLLGNVKDFVIDTHILPISPTTFTYDEYIHVGGYEVETFAKRVTSDYVDVDCGSISLKDATFYDSFLDLQTRIKLFLPFIGFVDIPPQYAWCHTIRVIYRFNVLDGSCMAFVSSSIVKNGNTSIIGVYSGSACVHMPLTGSNYSNIISGMIQTVSGVATGVATKNPLSAIGGVVSGIANMSHPNISMSNNYNASTGFMGCRKPYMLIEKPTQNIPTNFYARNGGLCMTSYKLEDLRGSGFTTIVNTDTSYFDNWKESEKNEIKRLLEQGVYL